ncbi:MAG: tRNA 5-methoxyuridine(34)/uridine 5-oxyacetic acid(34) synthase CmoB [Methylococcales bacterium]|jgi:tRNA (mo5U34)-methyltransferase|nr:tRNA 5-methoxyuridine(34)/uridine 5-oxyacetic acid(34) synthase CmoB [Methylococcales bacterium]MBT3699787.1 tRNA 5-methoxyuridine(34)/uridine 5-oxyacetic acid(34) synthase CmoB [Methylococcales bacterium]MBT3816631.1 tRNA 5-methoxyuridine(34)/uridine 5-oxyacetic acid(34) synthase CmoB [Methylococcales bacterium]MBT4031587.1 tRNA 5-methoxyuridine(34)/uridine 5-oxyacetic acid(34) synthase CmoB [Methylococcales bacterium]MBT5952239.1 tRNA 5-methoxyuridine(34)/uridine 5-oxyacetic acid(34) synth
MIDYQPLYEFLTEANAQQWVRLLPAQIEQALSQSKHGSLTAWKDIVEALPEGFGLQEGLRDGVVTIGQATDMTPAMQDDLKKKLHAFHPWRKGPFNVLGVPIETEWRSDWKWDRLKEAITPLCNRLVLDVGCGNGYHCWRILGEQAKMVVGIDPTLVNVMQFQVIRKLYGEAAIYVLPLTLEQLPPSLALFDTVFSMGVLYHRRSPIDHLQDLRSCLRPGGELVLETLVTEGDCHHVMMPGERYAKMRNVWFLPSCEALILWLKRCGFKNIRLIDVSQTTVDEQRRTEWMTFNSLQDFLDPDNQDLTCEGMPAPRRAIIIANNP